MGQLANHQLQRVEGGDHRGAQAADLIGAGFAGQKGIAVTDRLAEPVAGGANQHRGQAPRPEDRPDHRSTDNAQADFLGPRRGDIEHRQRVVDHRQGNHRQGVASKHQRIAVGGAQVQREEQQGAGPQGHGDRQQHRRLHQQRHQKHRPGSAEQGAHGAIQSLGTGRPDERAGDDINRGHGPVRPWQLHEQGNVQGNHRCGEGAHTVEPVARGRH
ncbi:hypothetical protein D3C84_763910 [compost metagenome]